jgi:uncharacterized protein (TIGR02231 family)
MRSLRHSLVVSTLLASVLLPAARDAGAAAAPISAVTLYPGSASVLRSAQVESGATELVVGGLAGNFSTENLRVDADAGIHVGQIEIRDAAQTGSANPAQAALESRIQELKDQEAALDAESESAGIVKGYLERLGGVPGNAADQGRTPLDARTLAGIIDAIGRGASEATARIHRLAVQKRELARKVEALQTDLARLQGGSRDSRSLVIHLSAARAGTVRLSYTLASAGWRPGYRGELDSTAGTVKLVRTAQVSQKTGEDWTGVRLVLSTSQPRLSPVAPTPDPWLLSYAPPQPPGQMLKEVARTRAFAMSAPAPAPATPPPPAADEQDSYVPPTFQTDGVFATEFAVSGPVTLAADGRELSLELSAQVLPVVQRVQVTPRLDTAATVTAQAERPAGVWVPGTLQLYRDGNYVGSFRWNPQAAEEFALPFGRDDLVRVTLDHVKGQRGSTGVFERRNERRIADSITVKSAHAGPIDVLVLEASPVSTAEEITVDAGFDPEPTIRNWSQRRGVVGWERTLRPGESARFGINYTIAYPKDGTVTGLGR